MPLNDVARSTSSFGTVSTASRWSRRLAEMPRGHAGHVAQRREPVARGDPGQEPRQREAGGERRQQRVAQRLHELLVMLDVESRRRRRSAAHRGAARSAWPRPGRGSSRHRDPSAGTARPAAAGGATAAAAQPSGKTNPAPLGEAARRPGVRDGELDPVLARQQLVEPCRGSACRSAACARRRPRGAASASLPAISIRSCSWKWPSIAAVSHVPPRHQHRSREWRGTAR